MPGDSRGTFVELDGEPDAQHDGTAVARGAPQRGTAPGGGARRTWAVVLGLAVVAAAGVYAVVDERGRQTDLGRHGDVPGVVDSLAEPLEEAWRVDLGPGGSATQLADLLVTSSNPRPPDGPAVAALDLATGAERWRVEGPAGAWPATCDAALDVPDGSVLLCALWVTDATDAVGQPVVDWHLVDAATGEATRLEAVDDDAPWFGVSVGQVGEALLLVERDDGTRTTHVTRYDVPSREAVWRTALSVEVGLGAATSLVTVGDLVVVRGAEATVVLDADGRELQVVERTPTSGPAPERLPFAALPGHGVGIWTDPTSGVWVAPDGERTATLTGTPVEVDVVGDAEPPVVVLVRDGALVGVDVGTGEDRWERPAAGRARALLDGRLVLSERDRLVALDVRTGETLWETRLGPAVEGATSPTLTDGVRLALTGQGDGAATLSTFELASGRQVWDAPLPEGTRLVQRQGRAVVAVIPSGGREDVVVLR